MELNLNLKVTNDGKLFFHIYDVVEIGDDLESRVLCSFIDETRAENFKSLMKRGNSFIIIERKIVFC